MKHPLRVLRWLLFPSACAYAGITMTRNWLYNKGVLPSHTFPVPTIVVGNLTVGGTGKTPHTEYLIRLLKNDYNLVILSRGYGRKTKGFRVADEHATPQQIGDEPMQFYRKFGRDVMVTVGEDRVAAIRQALRHLKQIAKARPPEPVFEATKNSIAEKVKTPLILLDDAFQHRPVKPSFSIMLTDYNRLFYRDFLLPTGNLRETRRGARRANAIIVSKCPPDLSKQVQQQIIARIRKYSRLSTPVFFTGIQYGAPVGFLPTDNTIFTDKLVLVSGLAQAGTLEAYVRKTYDCQFHLAFKDHHDYTQADVDKIRTACHKTGSSVVLTTGKDYVKLVQLPLPPDISFYYLPIEIFFLFDEGQKFNQLINP